MKRVIIYQNITMRLNLNYDIYFKISKINILIKITIYISIFNNKLLIKLQ